MSDNEQEGVDFDSLLAAMGDGSSSTAQESVKEPSLIGGSGRLSLFPTAASEGSLASVIEGAASDADTAAVQEAMPDPTPAVEASAAETPAAPARVEESSSPEAAEEASENGGFVLTRIPDGVKGVGDKTRAALQAMGPGRVFGTELELADALRKQAKVVKPVEVVEALVESGAFEPVEEAEGYRFPVDLTTNKIAGIGPKTARELEGRVLTHDQLKSIAPSNAKKIETGLADAGIEYRTPAYVAHQDEIRSLQDIDPDTLEGGEVEDKKSFLNFVDKRGESTVRILDARIAGWREADVDQAAMALDQELGGDPDATTPSNLSKASVVVGREYERRHPKPVAEVAAEPAVEEVQDQAVEGPTGFEPIDHLDDGTTPGIGRLREEEEVGGDQEAAERELMPITFDELERTGRSLTQESIGRYRTDITSLKEQKSGPGETLRVFQAGMKELLRSEEERIRNRDRVVGDRNRILGISGEVLGELGVDMGRRDQVVDNLNKELKLYGAEVRHSKKAGFRERLAALTSGLKAGEKFRVEQLVDATEGLSHEIGVATEFNEALSYVRGVETAQDSLDRFTQDPVKMALIEEGEQLAKAGITFEPRSRFEKGLMALQRRINPVLSEKDDQGHSKYDRIQEARRIKRGYESRIVDLSNEEDLVRRNAPDMLIDAVHDLNSGGETSIDRDGTRAQLWGLLGRYVSGGRVPTESSTPVRVVGSEPTSPAADIDWEGLPSLVDDETSSLGVVGESVGQDDDIDQIISDLGTVNQVEAGGLVESASDLGETPEKIVEILPDGTIEAEQAYEAAFEPGKFMKAVNNDPKLNSLFRADVLEVNRTLQSDSEVGAKVASLREYVGSDSEALRSVAVALVEFAKRSNDEQYLSELVDLASGLGLQPASEMIRRIAAGKLAA